MKAWETGAQLRDLLAADSRVGLSSSQLDECFDPARFLANSWSRVRSPRGTGNRMTPPFSRITACPGPR